MSSQIPVHMRDLQRKQEDLEQNTVSFNLSVGRRRHSLECGVLGTGDHRTVIARLTAVVTSLGFSGDLLSILIAGASTEGHMRELRRTAVTFRQKVTAA